MAVRVGDFGSIVSNFSNSLQEIIGISSGNKPKDKGGDFSVLFGGPSALVLEKWTGNNNNGYNSSLNQKLRYAFKIIDLKLASIKDDTFVLQIPPQAITQKENFANNIQATRSGLIIESEGVIFKDIILQGTTGVFPGQRGGSSSPSITDLISTNAAAPAGVSKDGISKKNGVSTISGYEEFIRLRQFFLRYSKEKLENSGSRIMVFINEKDSQALMVEPMEFTMERAKDSPLQYTYKIVLKSVGDYSANILTPDMIQEDFFGKISNILSNTVNVISTAREALNNSFRFLERLSEEADRTINGPLRLVQYALEDTANGITNVMSIPEILRYNNTNAIEGIRSSSSSVQSSISANDEARASAASEQFFASTVNSRIKNDNRVPITRQFVEDSKESVKSQSDDVADFSGTGSSYYNEIKGRITTNPPDINKEISDEELLVLGNLQTVVTALNMTLASNDLFKEDTEELFKNATAEFQIDSVPDEMRITLQKPRFTKEITILQNDTLERIAQRVYGDASRWIELVIINNLKPPYVNEVGGNRIKKYGDKLLVATV